MHQCSDNCNLTLSKLAFRIFVLNIHVNLGKELLMLVI